MPIKNFDHEIRSRNLIKNVDRERDDGRPRPRWVFRTKVHALGQMWAKWGQAKGKPIVEGRDWTEYDGSAGSGLTIVLSEKKAGPKSVESRSQDLPPGKEIAPEPVPRPSLEILEPKARPRALSGAPRGAPGTGPGRPRSSMWGPFQDRKSIQKEHSRQKCSRWILFLTCLGRSWLKARFLYEIWSMY